MNFQEKIIISGSGTRKNIRKSMTIRVLEMNLRFEN